MVKFQFVGEMKSNRICHGFVPWLFSLSSVGQLLRFAGSSPLTCPMDRFQKTHFLLFAGSNPLGEEIDLFCNQLFVNNLCLTQKTGRI